MNMKKAMKSLKNPWIAVLSSVVLSVGVRAQDYVSEPEALQYIKDNIGVESTLEQPYYINDSEHSNQASGTIDLKVSGSSTDYGVVQYILDDEPIYVSIGGAPVVQVAQGDSLEQIVFETLGHYYLKVPPVEELSELDSAIYEINNYFDVLSTDAESDDLITPDKFSLLQNYPNPFNGSTKINYFVGQSGAVNLSIYNLKGEKVKTLVDEVLSPGLKSVAWDGRGDSNQDLSSGCYIMSLDTGSYKRSALSVLLK